MQLYSTRTKQALSLGPEIARGAEGAISLLPTEPAKLAKRYLSPPDARKVEKLQAMLLIATEALIRVAAWPTELLVPCASDAATEAVAFVMQKVASPEQLHELYTPKSRAQSFPEADLRFVLHVAANVVRAFGTVHEAGHVIGDVNHGHLLIGDDGRVTLVDCDSFQISAGKQVFTCDVGVPLFTAPELQGQSFRGLMRTANHDRFGLAVLLFHLLFMGRHPYAGVPVNPQQSAEIEPAIRAGRFAYGVRRQSLGVNQPPGTIPLGTYGRVVADLFEAAFAHAPSPSRPDESAWLAALVTLQGLLRPCSASPSHQYPNHLNACPWCAIEARTGVRLFGLKLHGNAATGTADLATLWRAIEAIPRPKSVGEPLVDNASLPARTLPERQRKAQRAARIAAVVVIAPVIGLVAIAAHAAWALILLAIAAFRVWPRVNASVVGAARDNVSAAEREYSALLGEWRRSATEAQFFDIERRLSQAKSKLEGLPAEKTRRVAVLTSESKQQESFLDRYRIAREKIPGVGTGRAAALASFGIETAWDISHANVLAVPGFGPGLASKLVAWRDGLQARFQFNPNQTPAAADVRAIDADLVAQLRALTAILQCGPPELQRANEEAAQARKRLQPLIMQRHAALLVARRVSADLGAK